MNKKRIKNCQFVIFRSNDEFFEADNRFINVYLSDQDAMYPEMNDGEFALVTADVTRCEGGEAGYMGNKFIDKLISYKIISSDEAAQRCDIPEISEANFSYDCKMLMYHSGENIYCVFFYNGNYLVYLNNTLIGEYEDLDEKNGLSDFLDDLDGSGNEQNDGS